MNEYKRFVLKIGGESGQGVNSIGEILAFSLKRSGFNIFGYREYPSLIKGGFATYQIDVCENKINSSVSNSVDLSVCLSRVSIHKILPELCNGSTLIHTIETPMLTPQEVTLVKERNINIVYINLLEILKDSNLSKISGNVFIAAVAWKTLCENIEILKQTVTKLLSHKTEFLESNLKAVNIGYSQNIGECKKITFSRNQNYSNEGVLISGNDAMGIGSIKAGTRIYYSYPMTPTSNLLYFLAFHAENTKMIVKQAEDEITAVQMALGSMHTGIRALVATSGGGFDLMTESVSMAGMTEIPLVVVLGQRPGPATGLPTWTSATDLNLALNAGHGEFPRCVISVDDAYSSFTLIQHAFNIAEKYQIPVIILTEKQIAESLFFVNRLESSIPIERGLTRPGLLFTNIGNNGMKRYQLTDTGISPRWLPGENSTTYIANSDEHYETGRITEDAKETEQMYNKRLKKLKTLEAEIPSHQYFGDESPEILLFGFGSVKNAVVDSITMIKEMRPELTVGYCHYQFLYPFKKEDFLQRIPKSQKTACIENNALGQFAGLIAKETGYKFEHQLLKYNGRPFFANEIIDYLNSL